MELNVIDYQIRLLELSKTKYNIINDEIIINDNFILYEYNMPYLNNCIINGYVNVYFNNINIKFLNNCIINGQVNLNIKNSFRNMLNNCNISGDLHMEVSYLTECFNPNVKGRIHLPNLKSKILKELLLLPGPKRQLAYNLLKTIY